MRLVVSALLVMLLLACDPIYMKRFPVDGAHAAVPIEHVLARFEAEQLAPGFSSIDDPLPLVDGYHTLRTYSRDTATASRGGHHVRLLVLVHDESSEILLAPFAFPSFDEPDDLRSVRDTLTAELCGNGFRVKDACGAPSD